MNMTSLLTAAVFVTAMAHPAAAAPMPGDGVGSGGGIVSAFKTTLVAKQQEKPCTWIEIRCGGGGLGPIIIGGCDIKINYCPKETARLERLYPYPCWQDDCSWPPVIPGGPIYPPVPWIAEDIAQFAPGMAVTVELPGHAYASF